MHKTLVQHGKKEALVLQDRMDQCAAATALNTVGLAVAKVKEYVLLLKNFHHVMPYEMRCSITQQLCSGKLAECIEISATDIKKALTCAELCVGSVSLHLPVVENPGESIAVESIDILKPRYAPLVAEMEQQALMDSEAAGFFGGGGAHAADGNNSEEEDAFFGKPSAEPSAGSAVEVQKKEPDSTRNWEAG